MDVAEPRDYDRVSAFGFALGYLGVRCCSASVVMLAKPAVFGFATTDDVVRLSFLLVAAWWGCSPCRCRRP